MARSEKTLIEQIEQDALNEDVPLATTLRKCVVLGGKSGSEALRDWATHELKGYGGDDDLPDYRVVHAPLLIDGISGNYQISRESLAPMNLPDFAQEVISERLELRDGVGNLEALLQSDEIRLAPPGAADLVNYMNATSSDPFRRINRLYWGVAHPTVQGVLDQIRTALTQLVAELRANMSRDQDVPTTEAADQAVSVVVTGKRSEVHVNTAHASGIGTTASTTATQRQQPQDSVFWTRSRKIGAFVVGLATIAGAVIAIIQFL